LLGGLMVGGTPLGSCAGGNCRDVGAMTSVLMGWSAGTALGVYSAGSLLDGRGAFLPTMGAGLLAGGAGTGLYAMNIVDEETLIPLVMGMSLLGSMAVYELTSAWATPRPRVLAEDAPSTGATWAPTVQVSSRGGSLGLVGRF
ncbi:hypothetical protein HPC49_46350, partial [Pyxidicoccus fallax]|nr:hypothetical protein [Pyxidicoccus fallax]